MSSFLQQGSKPSVPRNLGQSWLVGAQQNQNNKAPASLISTTQNNTKKEKLENQPQVKKPKSEQTSSNTNNEPIQRNLSKKQKEKNQESLFNTEEAAILNVSKEKVMGIDLDFPIKMFKNRGLDPYTFITFFHVEDEFNKTAKTGNNTLGDLSSNVMESIREIQDIRKLIVPLIKLYFGIDEFLKQDHQILKSGDAEKSLIKKVMKTLSDVQSTSAKDASTKALTSQKKEIFQVIRDSFKEFQATFSVDIKNVQLRDDFLIGYLDSVDTTSINNPESKKKRLSRSALETDNDFNGEIAIDDDDNAIIAKKANRGKKRLLVEDDEEDNSTEKEILENKDSDTKGDKTSNNIDKDENSLVQIVSELKYIKEIIFSLIKTTQGIVNTLNNESDLSNLGITDLMMMSDASEKNEKFKLEKKDITSINNQLDDITIERFNLNDQAYDKYFLGVNLENVEKKLWINYVYKIVMRRRNEIKKSIKLLKIKKLYLLSWFIYLKNVNVFGETVKQRNGEPVSKYLKLITSILIKNASFIEKMNKYLTDQYLAHGKFLYYLANENNLYGKLNNLDRAKEFIYLILDYLNHSLKITKNDHEKIKQLNVYSNELLRISEIEQELEKISPESLKIKAAINKIDLFLNTTRLLKDLQEIKTINDPMPKSTELNFLPWTKHVMNLLDDSDSIKLLSIISKDNESNISFINFVKETDHDKVELNAMSLFYIETKLLNNNEIIPLDVNERLTKRNDRDDLYFTSGSYNLIQKTYRELEQDENHSCEIMKMDKNTIKTFTLLCDYVFLIENEDLKQMMTDKAKRKKPSNQDTDEKILKFTRAMRYLKEKVKNSLESLVQDSYIFKHCADYLNGYHFGPLFTSINTQRSLSLLNHMVQIWSGNSDSTIKSYLTKNDEIKKILVSKFEKYILNINDIFKELFKYLNSLVDLFTTNYDFNSKTFTSRSYEFSVDREFSFEMSEDEFNTNWLLLKGMILFHQEVVQNEMVKNDPVQHQAYENINIENSKLKAAISKYLKETYGEFAHNIFFDLFEYLSKLKSQDNIKSLFSIIRKIHQTFEISTIDSKILINSKVSKITELNKLIYQWVLYSTFVLNQHITNNKENKYKFLLLTVENKFKESMKMFVNDPDKIYDIQKQLSENETVSPIENLKISNANCKRFFKNVDQPTSYNNVYSLYYKQKDDLETLATETLLRRKRYKLYIHRSTLINIFNDDTANFETKKRELISVFSNESTKKMDDLKLHDSSLLQKISNFVNLNDLELMIKCMILRCTYLINFINLILKANMYLLIHENSSDIKKYNIPIAGYVLRERLSPESVFISIIRNLGEYINYEVKIDKVISDKLGLKKIKSSMKSDSNFLKEGGRNELFNRYFTNDEVIDKFLKLRSTYIESNTEDKTLASIKREITDREEIKVYNSLESLNIDFTKQANDQNENENENENGNIVEEPFNFNEVQFRITITDEIKNKIDVEKGDRVNSSSSSSSLGNNYVDINNLKKVQDIFDKEVVESDSDDDEE